MGIFALKPGLTGLAQISGRDTLSIEEKYISNNSICHAYHCPSTLS